MVFSDPTFIFWFLPCVLAAYFILPRRLHNLVLLSSSLVFYAWGERIYLLALVGSIVLNWYCARKVDAHGEHARARRFVTVATVANLGLLICLKYANFLADNCNLLLSALGMGEIGLGPVHLPIGISFFAFQGISYVIDVYRGNCEAEKSLLRYGTYISFFPQLIAGPIVRYVDIRAQLKERRLDSDQFSYGIHRFIVGIAKKVIIADTVARPVDEIFALPYDQLSPLLAWFGVLGYALQIYFDFSGYSDMAIGLGHMFGFRFLENFNYPYIAKSLTDFWRQWHISLSTWFRDYLYIPLGGNRVRRGRVYLNLLTVFFLCGLWHGASWNYVVWGLIHGAFLILERIRLLRRFRVESPILQHFYVLFVVAVSWTFFRIESLPDALSYLKAMFGLAASGAILADVRMFIDTEVILVVIAGALGSTPLVPWLRGKFEDMVSREPRSRLPISALVCGTQIVIFAYSVLVMAAGSYSPFIYFRF